MLIFYSTSHFKPKCKDTCRGIDQCYNLIMVIFCVSVYCPVPHMYLSNQGSLEWKRESSVREQTELESGRWEIRALESYNLFSTFGQRYLMFQKLHFLDCKMVTSTPYSIDLPEIELRALYIHLLLVGFYDVTRFAKRIILYAFPFMFWNCSD